MLIHQKAMEARLFHDRDFPIHQVLPIGLLYELQP